MSSEVKDQRSDVVDDKYDQLNQQQRQSAEELALSFMPRGDHQAAAKTWSPHHQQFQVGHCWRASPYGRCQYVDGDVCHRPALESIPLKSTHVHGVCEDHVLPAVRGLVRCSALVKDKSRLCRHVISEDKPKCEFHALNARDQCQANCLDGTRCILPIATGTDRCCHHAQTALMPVMSTTEEFDQAVGSSSETKGDYKRSLAAAATTAAAATAAAPVDTLSLVVPGLICVYECQPGDFFLVERDPLESEQPQPAYRDLIRNIKKRHPPMRIVDFFPDGTASDETAMTLLYIARYGPECVRGGPWLCEIERNVAAYHQDLARLAMDAGIEDVIASVAGVDHGRRPSMRPYVAQISTRLTRYL